MTHRAAWAVGAGAVIALALVAGRARAQDSEHLPSVCPLPPPPDFRFWRGAWDVVNRQRQPTGGDPAWHETGVATALVEPVVGGCGLVEYWWGDLTFDRVRGFSVRAFDPARGRWTAALLWPGQDQPSFGTVEGSFRHGRGEFFTSRTDQHGRSTLTRFTFSDITPTSARWDAAASGDSGISWRPTWIMEFTRRPADAPEPMPAWADSVMRCEFPELYEFDFVVGAWAGTATIEAMQQVPAALRVRRVVGNCAVEERLTIGERFESYEIRAFAQHVDSWIAYRLDSDRPGLLRLEGSVDGGEAQLAGTRETADGLDILVTEQWQWRGDDGLTYTLRESRDNGQTWTVVVRADLTRTDPSRP